LVFDSLLYTMNPIAEKCIVSCLSNNMTY
jgi:hypothetical protein